MPIYAHRIRMLTALVMAFSTSLSMPGSSSPMRSPTSASSVQTLHSVIESRPERDRHFRNANRDKKSERVWFRCVGGCAKRDCKESRRTVGGKGSKRNFSDSDFCLFDGLGLSSTCLETDIVVSIQS